MTASDDERHPDEAGVLHPDRHRRALVHARLRAAAHDQQRAAVHGDRRDDLRQPDAEVAHAGVEPQRRALQPLRVEEADVGHAGREVARPEPAEQGDRREHRVVGAGVLHGEADPCGRQQQHRRAPHREVAPAEDRHGERVQRAEDGAGEPRQRRQPEELVGRELEPDVRQLDHDHAPHDPDREGQQQRGHRQPEIAVGDAPAGRRSRIPRRPAASRRARAGAAAWAR